MSLDTIVALSSGALPSGVAVIRISGAACKTIISELLARELTPRLAELVKIYSLKEMQAIDQGLALWFPGPNSFTGEDCLELQVHGSRAVVSELLEELCAFDDVRIAEPGEFSKRAFENGKMDLTEVEGLADLIASETKQQRLQAFGQQQGVLRDLYSGWRQRLIHLRAMIEAEFDFSDEEDVPEEISQEGFKALQTLLSEVEAHLEDNHIGEIIRDGFQIVLLGKPNSGKSSLINYLSKREVAIVTDEPGTTRDIISVDLDLDGYAVRVTDTAGLRESDNMIEQEGIKRAREASSEADLILWLQDINDAECTNRPDGDNVWTVITKDDLKQSDQLSISTYEGLGVESLLSLISTEIADKVSDTGYGLITRKRYRDNLITCREHLRSALDDNTVKELQSEELRHASDVLGKITGIIDVEDLLDVIFSEFCIGK